MTDGDFTCTGYEEQKTCTSSNARFVSRDDPSESQREADFDAARRGRPTSAVPKNGDSWLPMNAL